MYAVPRQFFIHSLIEGANKHPFDIATNVPEKTEKRFAVVLNCSVIMLLLMSEELESTNNPQGPCPAHTANFQDWVRENLNIKLQQRLSLIFFKNLFFKNVYVRDMRNRNGKLCCACLGHVSRFGREHYSVFIFPDVSFNTTSASPTPPIAPSLSAPPLPTLPTPPLPTPRSPSRSPTTQ